MGDLVYFDTLPESARFAAQLYYARKNGLVAGAVPMSGMFKPLDGICLDPFKAEVLRYLETKTPPMNEWRTLFADGIEVLKPRGVVKQVAPDERELFDRYEIDLTRVVSGVVLQAAPRRWMPDFLNRYVTQWELRRLGKKRADELERRLLAEYQKRPQVTGMNVDPKDGIDLEALRVLLNERDGLYSISVNSNIPGSVILGLDRQFLRRGAVGEARERGVIVQGGTRDAASWFKTRERMNALAVQ